MVDDVLLATVLDAQERMSMAQREVVACRADFNSAVRRLHAAGASLREVASVTSLTFQRIHQIVDPGSNGHVRRPDEGLEDVDVVCGFCHRGPGLVGELLAGGEAFICDNCVPAARAALQGSLSARTVSGETIVRATNATRFVWCLFCRQYRRYEIVVVSEPDAGADRAQCMICEDCVGEGEDALRALGRQGDWVDLPGGGQVLR